MTLFEKIQNDPEPINWICEWDDFFKIIQQDYSEAKLIWNGDCREELYNFLENILLKYEKSINKLNKENNKINIKENKSKEINDKNPIDSLPNYKNIKMSYINLQKEVFVWKYYLKKLLKENQDIPSFGVVEIENPKILWKSIKNELCFEKNATRIVLMIKVMILLYKNYYQIKRKTRKDIQEFGKFKDYDFFLNLYLTNDNIEIKSYIIQLLYLSITCQEKKKRK
jgi:hypothetical protein